MNMVIINTKMEIFMDNKIISMNMIMIIIIGKDIIIKETIMMI